MIHYGIFVYGFGDDENVFYYFFFSDEATFHNNGLVNKHNYYSDKSEIF